MKIKVALLDKDKEYLDRLTGVFNTKYADKLEVYSFTDEKNAIESVKEYRIDVLIAEEDFNIDKSEFKRNCGLAYFTGTPGIELIKDEIAICKYQRVDVIFKQILGVYSDMAGMWLLSAEKMIRAVWLFLHHHVVGLEHRLFQRMCDSTCEYGEKGILFKFRTVWHNRCFLSGRRKCHYE